MAMGIIPVIVPVFQSWGLYAQPDDVRDVSTGCGLMGGYVHGSPQRADGQSGGCPDHMKHCGAGWNIWSRDWRYPWEEDL